MGAGGGGDSGERKPLTAAELRERAKQRQKWAKTELHDARHNVQTWLKEAAEMLARADELEKEEAKADADEDRTNPSDAAADHLVDQHGC